MLALTLLLALAAPTASPTPVAAPTPKATVTQAPPAAPITRVRLDLATAPAIGPENAPITLVEFTDYQCPFCARADATVRDLRQRYGDRLRWVVMQNPLAFHADAPLAARAALAADAQGRFLEMHTRLMDKPDGLKRPEILGYAKVLGLDLAAFEAALDDAATATRLSAHTAQAQRIGATATPFFFVNGRVLRGAQPVEAFTALIDEELRGNLAPTQWTASVPAPAPPQVPAGSPPQGQEAGDAVLRRLAAIENELRGLRREIGLLRDQLAGRPATTAGPSAPARPSTAPAPPAPPAAAPTPTPTPTTATPRRVALDPERTLGKRDAIVGIVEFSEFQCPFCRRFRDETFPELRRLYVDTGKLRYSFRDLPLDRHTEARRAAAAARCAGRQKAYWQMHARLFAEQSRLGEPLYPELAAALKLDAKAFSACLADPAVTTAVDRDADEAARLGVSATPHFFIGRLEGDKLVDPRALVGAHDLSAFQGIIDELLRNRGR